MTLNCSSSTIMILHDFVVLSLLCRQRCDSMADTNGVTTSEAGSAAHTRVATSKSVID